MIQEKKWSEMTKREQQHWRLLRALQQVGSAIECLNIEPANPEWAREMAGNAAEQLRAFVENR